MIYNISDKSMMDLEEDLCAYAKLAEERGLKYAKARSDFDQLEDLKKVILAEATPLSGNYQHNGIERGGSVNDRTNEALKSSRYKEHLAGLAAAREEFYSAQVMYEAARNYFEAVRSVLTSRREQLKRGLE
jgi:hypothetical protein